MYIENLCQKRLNLFEKVFNMSSIVHYTKYNSYLTFQLNTLKIYHWTFSLSVNIVDFWIFGHNRRDEVYQ